MPSLKFLLVSAFALFATASPLLPRDTSPADSITYCSTPADTLCTTYTGEPVVDLPPGWSGHFECYVTDDYGVDRYFAGHPPAAPSAHGLSAVCFADARELKPAGDKGRTLCLKSQLTNCCALLAYNNVTIDGLDCNKVPDLATYGS